MTPLLQIVRLRVVNSAVAAKLSPEAGLIAAVVGPGGLDVFPFGKGLAVDTPVEIGSVTKVFTALLVADAVVRKELQLSTQIDDLLFGERWEGAPAIDVEQLATHTSGLPRLSIPHWQILLHRHDPYRGYDRQHLIEYLQETRPRAPSGSKVDYSNLGYAVLGLMLERAASKAYEQLLLERLLLPLNMRETGLQLAGGPDRATGGYLRSGGRASLWHQDAYAPCGAMVSTVDDLVKALRGFLSGGTAISEALTLTLQPRAAMPGGDIGLGWILPAGGRSYWHNGATAGYTSYLGVYKPASSGVVVAANQSLAKEATELGHQLMHDVAQDWKGNLS